MRRLFDAADYTAYRGLPKTHLLILLPDTFGTNHISRGCARLDCGLDGAAHRQ
jgi:hypothetical protein